MSLSGSFSVDPNRKSSASSNMSEMNVVPREPSSVHATRSTSVSIKSRIHRSNHSTMFDVKSSKNSILVISMSVRHCPILEDDGGRLEKSIL